MEKVNLVKDSASNMSIQLGNFKDKHTFFY